MEIKCNRCWRDNFKLPIGLIIYIAPKNSSQRVLVKDFEANICDQHALIVGKYISAKLQVLPRSKEDMNQTLLKDYSPPIVDETLTQPNPLNIGDNHAHIF